MRVAKGTYLRLNEAVFSSGKRTGGGRGVGLLLLLGAFCNKCLLHNHITVVVRTLLESQQVRNAGE